MEYRIGIIRIKIKDEVIFFIKKQINILEYNKYTNKKWENMAITCSFYHSVSIL